MNGVTTVEIKSGYGLDVRPVSLIERHESYKADV